MRFFVFALTSVVSLLACSAATLPFSVRSSSWTKIAECMAEDGINIRRAPSVSAPRLVYNESKIEDYDTPLIYYGYWGTKTGGNIQPVLFGGIAPVVSEQNGWIELLNEGPRRESNAWVSAKYCKVKEITPISTSDNVVRPAFLMLDTKSDVEGNYAIYYRSDEMEGVACFYLGRVADGKVVCPYVMTCEYNYMSDVAGENSPVFVKGQYGYTFNLTKAIASGKLNEYGSMEYSADLSRFSTDLLNLIIQESEPLETPAIVYLYDGDYCLAE